MTPGSPEWQKLVTASKVAAILGVSPWESPRSMWHKMRGDLPAEPPNKTQSRGTFLEPAILAWWRDRHGVPTAASVAIDDQWAEVYEEQPEYALDNWAAATPDARAWVDGQPVLVEAKSTNSLDDWGDEGTDAIPTYYLVQVMWQMHVSGIHRCYVPIIGPRLEFGEYVVDYVPEWGQQLEQHVRAFYDSLAGDEPPDLDDSKATYEAVRRVHRLIEADSTVEIDPIAAHDLVQTNAKAKALEPELRRAKSVAIDAMGTARYLTCNGVRIARRQPRGDDVTFVITAKPADLDTELENAS